MALLYLIISRLVVCWTMSESARLNAEWATKLTGHALMIQDEWTRLKLYFIEMGAIVGYRLFPSYYKAHASEHHGLVYVMPLHTMSNSQGHG